jgi:hypothetical protein
MAQSCSWPFLGAPVISEAGTAPNVAALVYICALVPDKDESVNTYTASFPADGPQPILPPRDGFLFLDRDKFHTSFAADVPADFSRPIRRCRGVWSPRWAGHRPRLADEAKLVPSYDRRPDDPPASPAHHVGAGRLHRSRGGGQSLVLRVAGGFCRLAHQTGRVRRRFAPVTDPNRQNSLV